jgi:hypothetical protein
MIDGALSNPLLGVASAMIIGDILYRLKIIDLGTFLMISVGAGVVEASQVAGEASNIISDFTNITHVFGSQAKATDPTRPSATTIVLNTSGQSHGDLDSLMNREGKQ